MLLPASLCFSFRSGAIYLKNHVNTYWTDYNDVKLPLTNSLAAPPSNESTGKLYVIGEADKDYLRNFILDAITHTKDPLRCQLITTAGTMIKSDFPSQWTQFINQIHQCLSTDNINAWESSLLVFYTLVQHYEYKKVEDRLSMDDVMTVILPLLQQRFMHLFTQNESDQSALIQKQIFKIFHAYTQVRAIGIVFRTTLSLFVFSSPL